MKIAIDFDGTCVTHEFPKVGRDIGAVPVLKELIRNGHQLILYTMRSDMDEVKTDDPNIFSQSGAYLTDAINWFKKNDIELYSIQKDIGQEKWTESNKCYAELYIDDAALGCPLIEPEFHRPYVDWYKVAIRLMEKGIIKKTHNKIGYFRRDFDGDIIVIP